MAITIPIVTSFDGGGLDKATKDIERAEGAWNKTTTAVDKFAPAAGIAFAGVTAAAAGFVHAAEESRQSTARLEQVYKSMGDSTGALSKHAENYAQTLMKQTGIDDELIQNAQAKIATFGKVSDAAAVQAGVFDRATAAAADLAAAGFGSLESNAVQLGKALQDPEKGISALARSGVTFTQQQKDQIKVLMESGKQLEAQKLVLAAIEGQVGGTAAATATGSQKMATAWGNVSEAIGAAMLPVFDKLVGPMQTVAGLIEEHSTLFAVLLGVIGAISGAVLVFAGALKALEVIKTIIALFQLLNVTLLASPWFWIVAAIAAVVAALVLFFTKTELGQKIWGAAMDGIKAAFNAVKDAILWALDLLWSALKLWFNLQPAVILFKNLDKIRDAFKAVFDWIASALDWLVGVFSNAIDKIVGILSKPLDALKKVGGFIGKLNPFAAGVAPELVPLPAGRGRAGPVGDVYNVTVTGALDADGVARQIAALLQQAATRRGGTQALSLRGRRIAG